MKAVIIGEFGGPEVLHVADRGLPEPSAVQVRAAAHAVVGTGHGRGKIVLLVD